MSFEFIWALFWLAPISADWVYVAIHVIHS